MERNQAVQEYIHRAKIERIVYIADLTAECIAAAWHGIRHSAEVVFSAARAKTRHNVFTFDT